jgi:hypothetical protein
MDIVEIREFCRSIDKPLDEFVREFDELLQRAIED